LICPQCSAQLRLITFVTTSQPVQRILTRLGEPAEPRRIAPARGPPALDDLLESLLDWEPLFTLCLQPFPYVSHSLLNHRVAACQAFFWLPYCCKDFLGIFF